MAQNNEYMGPSVQSSACSYATLSRYNNGTQGVLSLNTALPVTSGRYVTPTFSPPPGYNTISSRTNAPLCVNYNTIQNAYGNGAGSCSGNFVAKLCQ
jgi:hypothetical protein